MSAHSEYASGKCDQFIRDHPNQLFTLHERYRYRDDLIDNVIWVVDTRDIFGFAVIRALTLGNLLLESVLPKTVDLQLDLLPSHVGWFESRSRSVSGLHAIANFKRFSANGFTHDDASRISEGLDCRDGIVPWVVATSGEIGVLHLQFTTSQGVKNSPN